MLDEYPELCVFNQSDSLVTAKAHLLVSKTLSLDRHFLLQYNVLWPGYKHLKTRIYNGNTDDLTEEALETKMLLYWKCIQVKSKCEVFHKN